MVVSVDPWTLSTAMFGIPRNWGAVPMPDEWPGPAAHPDLANTIYQYGWDNADLFGDPVDPGAEATMRVFGDLLDIEIDRFIKINMEGFVALIDALGGVEINVTFEVHNDFSLPAEARNCFPQRRWQKRLRHESGSSPNLGVVFAICLTMTRQHQHGDVLGVCGPA